MRASLIAVGSELLRRGFRESHSDYLTPRLEDAGWEVVSRRVVSDDEAAVARALSEARGEGELVLVTGGIGPTRDDRTREALARALNRPLRRDPASLRAIRTWCRAHRLPFRAAQARQALLPIGARAVSNPVGSAPGIWYRDAAGSILVLPGVFGEMSRMFLALLPRLRRASGGGVVTATLQTAGVGESVVDRRIAAGARRYPELEVTTLASPGEVKIQIRGRGRPASRQVRACRDWMAARLGRDLVSARGEGLEEAVVRLLRRSRRMLATAESCTAGLVSARLTRIPGASRVFLAGAVCYNDRAKERVLSVPSAILRRHGAVSAATARAMARGAAALFGASIAVAVTGIAGPGGGTPAKPVGSVVWAVWTPRGTRTRHRRLPGDREKVRQHAAAMALDLVRRALLRELRHPPLRLS